jgi:hypothetical protein
MGPLIMHSRQSRLVSVLAFVAAFLATSSEAQPPISADPALSGDQRGTLIEAARDTRLPVWQREFMSGLATEAEESAGPAAPAPMRGTDLSSTDGYWSPLLAPITQRTAHTAVYDPVRHRMLVFGGFGGPVTNETWALSLTGNPTWSLLTPTGIPPSPRHSHTAIYDPVRDQMVVFGSGGAYGASHDVWALSLAGSTAWTQLFPTGAPPGDRSGHTAIYDPVRDRMIVFGGGDFFNGLRNDVWALSLAGTPSWSQLAPAGTPPSPRSSHTAIYDPVRDRMVIFGGTDDAVWALALAGSPTWTRLIPPGVTSSYSDHTAIYDPVRDQMVVFGGPFGNTTFALSLGNPAWSQLLPTGDLPLRRYSHTAIYDPVGDRMVVFGGSTFDGTYGSNSDVDTWALELSGNPAWSELLTPPTARSGHTAIYDPVRDQMVVFGGDVVKHGDVWGLGLAGSPAWTRLTPAGTAPNLSSHSAIYDPVRDQMVVFGGTDGSGYLTNDVWALTFASPAWSLLSPEVPDYGRCNHTAIYDPVRDRMIVFGGLNQSRYPYNDVWTLSLAGSPTRSELLAAGVPPSGRGGHTAIYDPVRDRMIVFGGYAPGTCKGCSATIYNDVWALSLSGTPAWSQILPAGTAPSAHAYHTAIYDPVRDRMVVFGGISASPDNNVWALSLAGSPTWSQLAPAGTLPNGRSTHTAIYDPTRDRMVVFGGQAHDLYGSLLNDAWALNWDGITAVQVSQLRAEAEPGLVRLAWLVADPASFVGELERRTENTEWEHLADLDPDGAGLLEYEDRAVSAAERYGYRLAYRDGAELVYSPEIWVDVPSNAVFALDGPRPNPARDELQVAFSLPNAEPARLELYDLSGRRVLSREVGSLGTGTHRFDMSQGVRLAAGVYHVRLTQGSRSATQRAVIVR